MNILIFSAQEVLGKSRAEIQKAYRERIKAKNKEEYLKKGEKEEKGLIFHQLN